MNPYDDGPPLIPFWRYFGVGTPLDTMADWRVTPAMRKHLRHCERLRAHAARYAEHKAKPVPKAS